MDKVETYGDLELAKMIAGNEIPKLKEEAFSCLYDRHQKQVYTLCHFLLYNKDAVPDIFQEAFSAFYYKLSAGEVPESPIGYLINTARNLCYKYNRDRKVHSDVDDAPEPQYNFNYDNVDLMEKINHYVDKLEYKYKEIFILKEFQGYSHEDIAEFCGISISTSKVRLHRAHKQLQEFLRPYIKEIKSHG